MSEDITEEEQEAVSASNIWIANVVFDPDANLRELAQQSYALGYLDGAANERVRKDSSQP